MQKSRNLTKQSYLMDYHFFSKESLEDFGIMCDEDCEGWNMTEHKCKCGNILHWEYDEKDIYTQECFTIQDDIPNGYIRWETGF